MKRWLAAVILICLAPAAFAQQPNDYGKEESWLCRPGRHGACDVDLTTTVIDADGRFAVERWQYGPAAPIDCFYVYPTVSTDSAANSDMSADAAELNVVRQQFARFGSKCRLYAPLYRQITLAGLRSILASGLAGNPFARGVQYDDVRAAWNWYLEHDNAGRGVVLVGHSQGSFILLEVTVHSEPADPRTDDIIGDLTTAGRVLPEWGLHLVDMDIAMGNLIDLVGQQARAWLSARK